MKKDQIVIFVPQMISGEELAPVQYTVIKTGTKFFEIMNEKGETKKCKKVNEKFKLGVFSESWSSFGSVYENEESLKMSKKWQKIFNNTSLSELNQDQKDQVFDLILSFENKD